MRTQLPEPTHELLQRLVCGVSLEPAIVQDGLCTLLDEVQPPARDAILGAVLHGLVIADAPAVVIAAALTATATPDGTDFRSKVRVTAADGEMPFVVSGGGKKGRKMLNISTPATIIAASAGIPIIKTGSSATSCVTGSADLTDAYGIKPSRSAIDVQRHLERDAFAFISVGNEIPNFMEKYEGRFFATSATSFGLGVLMCPYEGAALAFGISHPNVKKSADVLREFGIHTAVIVSSTDDDIHFVDELLPWGYNRSIFMNRETRVENEWQGNFARPSMWWNEIGQQATTDLNARSVTATLRGEGHPLHEEVVVMNAGLLFHLSGRAESLTEGTELAREKIHQGAAWATFQSLQQR